MKKLILCVLTGAIVAWFWSFISWAVLPWHMLDFKQFSNEEVVTQTFTAELQGTGLYTLPNMDPTVYEDEAKMQAWNDKAQTGPFAFISVRADGVEPGMALPMTFGFLLSLFMAAVLYWLVGKTNITCPIGRTVFIAVAATVGASYPHLSNLIYWYFPWSYCVVGVVDVFITWALAGFVMVKLFDKLSAKAVTES